MDKVFNFEENYNTDEDYSIEEEENSELSEYEIDPEERAYYHKLTTENCKSDLTLFTKETKKTEIKYKKNKKNNKTKKLLDLEIENKPKWKSKRAEMQKFKNGKQITGEKRKFNPRPLPLDWNKENENLQAVNDENNFPVLGNPVNKKIIPSVWGRKN